MPVAISSVISSIINFWQNCVLNINLPDISVPEWLKNIIGYIMYFFSYMLSLLPALPDFDIRATLVITALGIPFILDIFTVWFTNPILKTIAHIIDLAAAFFLAFFVVDGCYTKFETTTLIFIVLAGAWLIGHFIYYRKHKMGELSLKGLGKELANYFLDGILPGMKEHYTLEQIDTILSRYMSTVKLVAEKSPVWVTIVLFVVAAAAIVGICIVTEALDIGVDIPASVQLFLPYILLPVAILCFIIGILKVTDCGAVFILKFKQFIKRWGLRLLMLLLEVLYIPILTSLVDNVIPNKYSCPTGTEPYIQASNSTFYIFEKHTLSCAIYNTTNPNKTISEWRMYSDNSLLFLDDVIKVNGGTILFSIFFIMLGIPFLWQKLVSMNREFVFSINVYGDTIVSKWNNIANRLETTGIFLFQKYTIQNPNWSVWLLFAKFIVLLINTLIIQFSSKLAIMLPIYYIFMIIVTWYKSPYLFKANNFFDIVLYIFNCAYSIIPILAAFGVDVSTNIISIISIALIIIPVVSCVIFLLCGEDVEENPTVITKELQKQIDHEQEEEEMNEKRKKKKSSKKNKKTRSKRRGKSDRNDESLSESDSFYLDTSEEEANDYIADLKTSVNLKQSWENDKVKIPQGGLDSIVDFIDKKKTQPIKICHMMLARRFQSMYNIVDVIIDSQTINYLANFLNIMVLFAAAAFGWYINAVSQNTGLFDRLHFDDGSEDTNTTVNTTSLF